MICQSASSVGEYVGTKEVGGVVFKFKDCRTGGFECTSEGHPLGELETNVLEGRAVWESEALHKTAFELHPAIGERFIDFDCGQMTVAVTGAVLVPIKASKMSETVSLKYKARRGHQALGYYEAGGETSKPRCPPTSWPEA
jgi:hypothetical protein